MENNKVSTTDAKEFDFGFAKDFKFELKVNGISIKQLSSCVGVHRSTIYEWLNDPMLTGGHKQRLINAVEKIKTDRQ